MKGKILIFTLLFFSVIQLNSQVKKISVPLIGEEAPSFTALSTLGNINFPTDLGSNWKILFAHPKDFTPVCSSELLELAQQQEEYNKLGVKLLVLSTDIISQHEDWVNSLNQIRYKDREPVKIKFPLIDDSNYRVSYKYGMIHPSADLAHNIRAVFIIDPKNKIRSIHFYPNEVGRNLDEVKRTLIALQTIDSQKNVVAPANWNIGDNLLIPVLTDEERANLDKPDSNIQQVSWFMNFRINK